MSIHVNSFISDNECVWKPDVLSIHAVDRAVWILAQSCPNLRRLVLELEVCSCTDLDLKGLAGFRNLQILKLIGSVNGLYDSVTSDTGLTILAQVCLRLLKLELIGCEGSYDWIKAIGQCCQMMVE
ncbi:putative leucine-rich repeat domain superfamily [Helianthus annuus]|nr:putative leucine-rich repeat domain superfamily [Helianthus annuus]